MAGSNSGSASEWDEAVKANEAAVEAERRRIWREEAAARIMAVLVGIDHKISVDVQAVGPYTEDESLAVCSVSAADALRRELDKVAQS